MKIIIDTFLTQHEALKVIRALSQQHNYIFWCVHMCNTASMIHIFYFTRLLLFFFWTGSPWCNISYCALSDIYTVCCLRKRFLLTVALLFCCFTSTVNI